MMYPVFWPVFASAIASQALASWLADCARNLEAGDQADGMTQGWTTSNKIALELETMRFRDFSTGSLGTPVIICAPFALHAATIADFSSDHSIVERLQAMGAARVHVTDWRSATSDMRFLSIDSYLSDLNVAVDSFDGPVDLVGLCQGGWLAALYSARFPRKVRRLVLAGAPIDIEAGKSKLSDLTSSLSVSLLQGAVDASRGLVPGDRILQFWSMPSDPVLRRILQLKDESGRVDLPRRFRAWLNQTVTLPGSYYLQAVQWLFKENRIARGEFVALGQKISLRSICIPLFLLAGEDDQLVDPQQLLAIKHLVGTPPDHVTTSMETVDHLTLFVGRCVLERTWARIGRWLAASGDSLVDVSQQPAARVS
jgi:poly(3-hydroxyalkanoate) synthetase